MKTTFSTLSCPGWELDRVLEYAVKYNYDGVDIRGLGKFMKTDDIVAFKHSNALFGHSHRAEQIKVIAIDYHRNIFYAAVGVVKIAVQQRPVRREIFKTLQIVRNRQPQMLTARTFFKVRVKHPVTVAPFH